MAGVLGKAVRGAAEAGAQLSLQQVKSDLIAKRDEKLHQYRMERQQSSQQFQAGQAQQERGFTAEQAQQQRGFTAEQNAADREIQERRVDQQGRQVDQQGRQLDMESERLGMQQEQHQSELDQLDVALQTNQLGLVQAQQAQQLRDTILDPQASESEKNEAAQMIRQITGNMQDSRYQFQTVGGEFGGQETPYAFDPLTGTAQQINMGNSSRQQAIEQLMEANPGQSEEWAREYLEELQSSVGQ